MSHGIDYGMMRRENLALKLALTFNQIEEASVTPALRETLLTQWLPVAEMAIHEILA